ncbi:hypothetical protein ABK040_003969 [Willaertia magna]
MRNDNHTPQQQVQQQDTTTRSDDNSSANSSQEPLDNYHNNYNNNQSNNNNNNNSYELDQLTIREMIYKMMESTKSSQLTSFSTSCFIQLLIIFLYAGLLLKTYFNYIDERQNNNYNNNINYNNIYNNNNNKSINNTINFLLSLKSIFILQLISISSLFIGAISGLISCLYASEYAEQENINIFNINWLKKILNVVNLRFICCCIWLILTIIGFLFEMIKIIISIYVTVIVSSLNHDSKVINNIVIICLSCCFIFVGVVPITCTSGYLGILLFTLRKYLIMQYQKINAEIHV